MEAVLSDQEDFAETKLRRMVNGERKGGEERAMIREREPGGKRDSGGYAFVSREHEDSKKGENHV